MIPEKYAETLGQAVQDNRDNLSCYIQSNETRKQKKQTVHVNGLQKIFPGKWKMNIFPKKCTKSILIQRTLRRSQEKYHR